MGGASLKVVKMNKLQNQLGTSMMIEGPSVFVCQK